MIPSRKEGFSGPRLVPGASPSVSLSIHSRRAGQMRFYPSQNIPYVTAMTYTLTKVCAEGQECWEDQICCKEVGKRKRDGA